MLKSHEKFYSNNGKRLILVADDESINREMLGAILEDQYEVIYAADGEEALQKIREHRQTLALILLDIMMPALSGLDLLRLMRADAELQNLPVIVLTADSKAEVESLTLGAADFIPKPYPEAGIIMARVLRTIELFEDRQIIRYTERDPLTGLYNREYFYRYAEQYDQYHPQTEMDAIVLDVHHFHIINDRFGMSYGDDLLRRIGEQARAAVAVRDGIVCRREADTFMIYCPHGVDYKTVLEMASVELSPDGFSGNPVRLRMGVYVNVDKTLDIERRFDRAKMAADTIRSSATKSIEFYNEALREKELYAETLIESFNRAIAEKQFKVYYQPKFNIRPAVPVLSSAEALVRWVHPQFGMISPGTFIPLFEENGLIQELDRFVWRTTAEQLRDWKNRYSFSVPVSVNVSRIDLFDPELINTLLAIVRENDLTPRDLLLEVTESAYTEDSNQIIETISSLREHGFRIEVDDFGSGYSSLNMISTLPIDALKLDMKFIRTAFKDKNRDTRMIEVIIDIAGYLSVPVIAEGVETEEQLNVLRSIGCDLVQGYYFSKPLPAEDFVPFLLALKETSVRSLTTEEFSVSAGKERKHGVAFSSIAQALSQDYFSIYYVDTETDWFVEYSAYDEYQDLDIGKSGDDFFNLSRKNVLRVMYPEDQPTFLSVFTKENILHQLEYNRSYSITYRLLLEGVPTKVRMKITHMMDKTDKHIVIGVSHPYEQAK